MFFHRVLGLLFRKNGFDMACHIWVLTLKSYLRIPRENCLMSFAMNVPIDRVISVCHLDVLDSLFLIANASRNHNCPLPLLTLCFFSPLALASSTPILTFLMTMPCFRLRWLFMEDVEPVAYLNSHLQILHTVILLSISVSCLRKLK